MNVSQDTVRISAIAAGGDGVARMDDGRVLFVPRTAPGDLVELRNVRFKTSFGRGAVGRMVEPSPDRVEPPCRHYVADDCGGCVLQHVSYDAQIAVKGRFVRDALERIAKSAVPPFDVVPNPRPLGWRTRLALSVDVRSGAMGLRRLDRPGEVFDLVTCEIASPGIRRLWTVLRGAKDLLPRGASRVTLREDRTGGLHVVLQHEADWTRAADVDATLTKAGVRATLWVQPEGRAPRLAVNAMLTQAARDSASVMAFEQVDPAMGDVVRAHALAALGDVNGRAVWDLYAGIGETTVALLAAGASVESVESDASGVAEARRRGPAQRVTRHAARVEDVVGKLHDPALVIANPPRAGLGPAVVDAILERSAARIVYVSCDPATLARDVARLSTRFRIGALRAFDSFPQTAHVETVATLDAL